MEARTALLVALVVAVALPYVTVALVRGGGRVGMLLLGSLFVAALLLVVASDRLDGRETPSDGE